MLKIEDIFLLFRMYLNLSLGKSNCLTFCKMRSRVCSERPSSIYTMWKLEYFWFSIESMLLTYLYFSSTVLFPSYFPKAITQKGLFGNYAAFGLSILDILPYFFSLWLYIFWYNRCSSGKCRAYYYSKEALRCYEFTSVALSGGNYPRLTDEIRS